MKLHTLQIQAQKPKIPIQMCKLENIKKGFFKTRTSQQIIDKYKQLMENQPDNADNKEYLQKFR